MPPRGYKAAMPILINGGPLDGGSFDFDGPAPNRITLDVPSRFGGPADAVYELSTPGPIYRLTAFREVDPADDPGQGT